MPAIPLGIDALFISDNGTPGFVPDGEGGSTNVLLARPVSLKASERLT